MRSVLTGGKRPLYEQIYSYIKHEIQEGQLLPGERLPSSRSLAALWRSAGARWIWLMSSWCRRVSGGSSLQRLLCMPDRRALQPGPERAGKGKKRRRPLWDYDLTPNGIDLDSFPYDVWRSLRGMFFWMIKESCFSWAIRGENGSFGRPSAVICTRPGASAAGRSRWCWGPEMTIF